VSVDPRLTRLRALVDGLERLPASARRDWMLAEARARLVDVDTGYAPRAMRALEEDRPIEPPATRGGNGRGVKRPSTSNGSAAGPPQPEISPVEAPRPAPQPDPVDAAAALLGTGGLLWLEDSPDSLDEPGNGSTASAPWRRGLRG
jgi:hypothetical protein